MEGVGKLGAQKVEKPPQEEGGLDRAEPPHNQTIAGSRRGCGCRAG
jgi:hypothetical protein